MTGAILLAAGSSSRLGMPKQNLLFQGRTLLERAVNHAGESCDKVIVILGANVEHIHFHIDNADVIILQNDEWHEGMSSSIRLGIAKLQEISTDIDSAILMLCDQPFADAALLNQLIRQKSNSNKAIVASGYNGTFGPPALFDKSKFPELLELSGREGAKKIIAKYSDELDVVAFPLGIIDIDTTGDYERLENEF
jgi:molybdenum cofactor cytidylyltransferase